ncbi:MAG: TonB-dependent receptor [Bacteroidia bacterium]|nr:TonB-dependent receptor [Bacteroidia bacterium]
MHRPITACAALLLCAGLAQAQPAPDSLPARQVYMLEEISIRSPQQAAAEPWLRFYQSQDLSSTEEVLSRLEGISLIRRGAYAMEPVMRGLSGNQIQVRIDGMHIAGACTDRMDPVTSYVEPSNLRSLESTQGAAGMEWGGSVGGSLNLQLKSPLLSSTPSFSGEYDARWASAAASWSQRISLGYGRERWGMRLSGAWRRAGDYRTGTGTRVPFSGYNKVNFALSSKWLLRNGSVLVLDLLKDYGWNIGYPALPMDVASADAEVLGLVWRRSFQARKLAGIEAKLYANRVYHVMDDSNRPLPGMRMDMPGWTRTAGAWLQTDWQWTPRLRTRLKADYYYSYARAEMTMYGEQGPPMFMLTWPDVGRGVLGVLAVHEWQAGRRQRLTLQARLDAAHEQVLSQMGRGELEIFGYDVDGVRYRLLPNGSIAWSSSSRSGWHSESVLAWGQRLPSINEAYGFYLFNRYDGFDYIGNPGLRAESSLQAEQRLRYQTQRSTLGLNLYGYRFRNYILGAVMPGFSVMTPGAAGVKGYENLPSAWLAGGELRWMQQWSRRWNSAAVLQYSIGAADEADPLPLLPPLTLRSSLRRQAARFWVQGEAEAALRQDRVSARFGEQPTPGWVLLNLRAGWKAAVRRGELELSAGAENLLDAAYREHLDWGGILRQGRNLYLHAGYRF